MAYIPFLMTDDSVPQTAPVDSPEITIYRLDTDAAVVSGAAMTHVGQGLWRYDFTPSTTLEYGYVIDADPNATGQVTPGERYFYGGLSGTDIEHLDQLDDTITSRASQASVDVIDGIVDAILVDTDTTIPALIAALNDIDIADVQTALTNQGYTGARAVLLDFLDAAISSRNSVVPLAAATDQAEHDATQAAIAGLNDPSTADIDSVLTAAHGAGSWQTGGSSLTAQDVRDAMKLAPTAGAPAAGSVDEALDTLQTDVTAILADTGTDIPTLIAALNDISIADVQTALTTQGYTAARALLIDNLDATISSRASQVSVDTVDGNVDAILVDTAIMEPLVSTNLDVTISSRSSHSAADVDTTLTGTHGAGAWTTADLTAVLAAIGAQNDISSADVTAAVWGLTETALAAAGETGELLLFGNTLRSDIDFTGNDALGWQLVVFDRNDVEIARANLFDEAFSRIPAATSVSAFIAANKAIARVDVI